MKKYIFLLFCSCILNYGLYAQSDCCNPILSKGKTLFNACEYDQAIVKFNAAGEGCTGCENEARSWKDKTSRCKNNPNASGCPCAQQSSSGSSYTETVNGVSFVMKAIPAGTFTMGCTSEQGSDCRDDEKPAHSVTLSAFYMGETEVTQALWIAVMGNNPSYFKINNLPVEQVSWDEVQTFLQKLNSMTGKTYKLPSEAQWEYAARGNQSYKYAGSNDLGSVAWYNSNSGSTTHNVKGKNANGFGLYDMSGNVWEWCQDYYNDDYTKSGNSEYRVCRGGSWSSYENFCRVSYRYLGTPAYLNSVTGFRLLRGTL